MTDPQLEAALREMEGAAASFATRLIRMAEVRSSYVRQISEMSASIRASVEAGEMTAQRGAEIAREMRNQILLMSRQRDLDLGRSLAASLKKEGKTLEKCIVDAMAKLKLSGRRFDSLSGAEQNAVFMEIIRSSGSSRRSVTDAIPRVRWAGRSLWLASILIAGYNIGTAENPWWQSGREAAAIAGGVGGGFAGGAAMGAAAGIWGGPVGVAIGILVGGVLGSMLADHAYVEAAGTSDPATRSFVARFTGFWSGVDEAGMARALASEHRNNAAFVHRVFVSLNNDYSTDVDDVALEYVQLARRDNVISQLLRSNRSLRDFLIQVMSEGWTSVDEQRAIDFLRAL
jgi:hypothetical protein